MLTNKVAVITGGASGIGRQFCLTMAGYGADIIVVDMNKEGAEETAEMVKNLGRKAKPVALNITNEADVISAVADIVKEFGRIDILCNNAGVIRAGLLKDMDEKSWDFSMNVNTKGAFFMSKAISKIMIEQKYGRIVNTASQAGRIGEYANGPYSISKAAVAMMTQIQALELAEYNILVNAIAPSYIDTPLLRKGIAEQAQEQGKTFDELMGELVETVPLKRAADPKEIAELVAFLASDRNSYMTGTMQFITGGKFMQ